MSLGPADVLNTEHSLRQDVRALGVQDGKTLLVHASMRSLGWVVGGARSVVDALRTVLGPDATLVVPTMTADNRDPSVWTDPQVPTAWWPTIREAMPAFRVDVTPSWRMGAIAEQVRTWPGTMRSGHPQTSFAALGPAAEFITDGHAVTCHLGEESPMARLEELDASVLLLGVGFERCSAFHLAEYRLPNPRRRSYSCVVQDPTSSARWLSYQDVVLDDHDFGNLGADFEEESLVVHTGLIGAATARLFPLRAAVEFAQVWLGDRGTRTASPLG